MEPNSKSITKIDNLLSEVILLLNEYNQVIWGRRMHKLLLNMRTSEDKKEASSLIMRSMLGGMGSLSDVVLYRDGKPLIEENDKLRELLDKLYLECKYL